MGERIERKRSARLSLLMSFAESLTSDALSRSPASRSPRSYDPGAIGLGIVAAMSEPARSEPIPIFSARATRRSPRKEEEIMLSETYTCVTSHVGGNPVKKRVYYDDGSDGMAVNYRSSSTVVFETPPPPAAAVRVAPPSLEADFLSRCYLCRKRLHGLDIFMYRGDMAFCSDECRHNQIINDEQREKCAPETRKPFACSESPCSTPFIFAAGVAAA
ncbi:hypothetical protein J5N97_003556 [Dioscorea zingiberensis]|uniref:FLZ-type domain-containing protein n=1 Tax=Dioscorea zingiberensis TaxID=325984 RepID=A0A9D5HQ69_9LILI|nr:hypothetical protein J5N97_003556 [Dioscorea zingiberensis]